MDTQNIEDKENKGDIKSVSDFLKKIKEIGGKEKGTLFYRGHANEKTFDLIPTIYRNNNFIQNEHKIYRETIAKVPYAFNEKNTIESLVLMQHYGVPTRILDLTTNPLVALYFACDDNKNDGEVIVFDIPEESTCYFDSDKVTILANLAKCKNDFRYKKDFFLDLEKNKERIRKLFKKKQSCSNKKSIISFVENKRDVITKKTKLLKKEGLEKNIETIVEELINEYKKVKSLDSLDSPDSDCLYNELLAEISSAYNYRVKEIIIPALNNYYFSNLLHYIREDKSHFKPIINPNDIGGVFAIKPKLDNPRIIRQYGAFLIFGAKVNKKEMPEVKSSWVIRGKKSTSKERLIIKSSEKKLILDELDNLGINKSTLFPEIDKVADYIKDKIQKKQI